LGDTEVFRAARREEHGRVLGPVVGIDRSFQQPPLDLASRELGWVTPAHPFVALSDEVAEGIEGGPACNSGVLEAARDELNDLQLLGIDREFETQVQAVVNVPRQEHAPSEVHVDDQALHHLHEPLEA
jgi:hypothetical protein